MIFFLYQNTLVDPPENGLTVFFGRNRLSQKIVSLSIKYQDDLASFC